ncbi:O-antigen ligase family protein [Streptomyces sp. NBC_01471]|uniref:O-antigen ligase family protein n=1 Tax=Streptomyces sp. NBC_01471 TaxID=2903879 RepID=UPI00352E7FE2
MTVTVLSPAPALPRPRTGRPAPPLSGRLARWWPVLPVAAPVILLAVPFEYGNGSSASTNISVADVASAFLVLFCAVRLLRRGSRPLSPAAAVVLGVPVVGLAVATVTAADPAAALPGFVRYLQVFVLVPAAVVLLLRDARDFRFVAGAFVVLALVQGGFGVWQYATRSGASYMGSDIRAVGTFGPTDVMGMATIVAFGTVAATGLALRPPPGAPRWVRPAALTAAVALVPPLAFSFSRGSWIATVAAVLAVVLLAGLRTAVRALAAVVAVVVVLVGGFGVGSQLITDRLGSITQVTAAPDQSVTDRYTMWAAAVSMWRDEPATGVGLKGFPAYRDGHASLGLSSGSDTAGAGHAYQRQPLLSPHNMYLLVLSEQGLVGITALAGSWAALLVGGARRLYSARRRRGAAADCGLVAVGLMLWQTVDFLYADIGGPSTALTGIVFGLVAWWALAGPDARGAVLPGAVSPGAVTAVAVAPGRGLPGSARTADAVLPGSAPAPGPVLPGSARTSGPVRPGAV